jgi:hypothetical protein
MGYADLGRVGHMARWAFMGHATEKPPGWCKIFKPGEEGGQLSLGWAERRKWDGCKP